MVDVIKKHKDYKEVMTLEITEQEGLVLGKYLAMMDALIIPGVSTIEDGPMIRAFYQKVDYLYHKARWCDNPKCDTWNKFGLEPPIAQESRKLSRKEKENGNI